MPLSPAELPRWRSPCERYELLFKPPGLPTLSLDCLDLYSLEALLAWRRGALCKRPDGRGEHVLLTAPGEQPQKEQAEPQEVQEPHREPHREPHSGDHLTEQDAAQQRQALPEEGVLHRLDTVTQGWVARATSPDVYHASVAARDAGRMTSFYQLEATLSREQDRAQLLWASVAKIAARSGDDGNNVYLMSDGDGSDADGFALEAVTRKAGFVYVVVVARMANANTVTRLRPLNTPMEGTVVRRSLLRVRLADLEAALQSREDVRLSVDAQICRGARHQLRLHLACLGTPIEHEQLYVAGGDLQDTLASAAARQTASGGGASGGQSGQRHDDDDAGYGADSDDAASEREVLRTAATLGTETSLGLRCVGFVIELDVERVHLFPHGASHWDAPFILHAAYEGRGAPGEGWRQRPTGWNEEGRFFGYVRA